MFKFVVPCVLLLGLGGCYANAGAGIDTNDAKRHSELVTPTPFVSTVEYRYDHRYESHGRCGPHCQHVRQHERYERHRYRHDRD